MAQILPQLPESLKKAQIRYLWDMTAEEVMYILDHHADFDPNPSRLIDRETGRYRETEAEYIRRVEDHIRFASLRKIVLRDMFGEYLFKKPDLKLPDLLHMDNRLRSPCVNAPAKPPFESYSETRRNSVFRQIWHEFNDEPLNGQKIFANITNRSAFIMYFVERVNRKITRDPDAVPDRVLASVRAVNKNYEKHRSETLNDARKAVLSETPPSMESLVELLGKLAAVGTNDPRMDSTILNLRQMAAAKINAKNSRLTAGNEEMPPLPSRGVVL